MNLRHVWLVAAKEIRMAPRGVTFVILIVFPLLITFLIHAVFGDLFTPSPRLGIHDPGSSVVVELARAREIDVTVYESEEALRAAVFAHDADAGLLLQSGFDDAVREGLRPPLQLFLSSEASDTDQLVLSVAVVDLVRELAGHPSPLFVETVVVGEGPTVPIEDRLMPLVVLVAVALAAIFLPGSTIVQERESRTLQAMLVTPLRVGEIMAGKGVVGFLLALIMGTLTVVIAGATGQTVAVLVVLAVAALMCVQMGLMLGAAVTNMAALFSIWKAGGTVIFAPAILLLFPDVPEWIARIIPTFYFLGPLYEIVVHGAALRSQALDLSIGVAISIAFGLAVAGLSRRMERRLAAG